MNPARLIHVAAVAVFDAVGFVADLLRYRHRASGIYFGTPDTPTKETR